MGIKKLYIGGENEDWEIPVTPLPKVRMNVMYCSFVYGMGHGVSKVRIASQVTQVCWIAGQDGSHARSNRPSGLLTEVYANLFR
jgi:hypothetical protein